MTLSTYAELQTAIQNYTGRSDTTFTDNYDNFVRLAEQAISDALRVQELEERRTLGVGGGAIPEPDDLNTLLDLRANYDPRIEVTIASPSRVFAFDRRPWTSCTPIYGARQADFIHLRPNPPDGTLFDMTYKRRPTALTASNSTNILFPTYSHVYYAATLAEAFRFMREFEAAALWDGRAGEQMALINERARRDRAFGNSRMILRNAP